MKGHAKVDDTDLLIKLIDNPELLFIGTPENPGLNSIEVNLQKQHI